VRKILAIVTQDLRVFLSARSNLPGLLLTPVVMTVIVALVNSGVFAPAPAPTRLDVIDRDQSPASSQFLEAVSTAASGLLLCPLQNTPDDACSLGGVELTDPLALDRVAQSKSVALLQIPAGFGEALAAQRPISLVLRSTGEFGPAQAAVQALRAALRQVNGAAVAASVGLPAIGQLTNTSFSADEATQVRSRLYQRALEAWRGNPVRVSLSLSGSEEKPNLAGSLQQGLGQSVPGMGTMFVMMTVFGGMAALLEERRQWTLQRLAMMPVSKEILLAGKIAARFSLGVVQFLVIFAVGAAFGMNFGKDPLALVLMAVAYTLSVTALSFALGSRLKTPAQASGLALLLTLTLAPLGGAWWPMDVSPRFMQIVGHISPIAWAMDGLTALTYQDAHLGDIWLPLAVLLGMTILAFLIAIPRFRYQVD
jgi:ABC-2 type transport system permease protein